MQKFCRAGADAVSRYIEVTGLDHLKMPEYFMPAFILNKLGDEVTATLETSFRGMVVWNGFAQEGQQLPQQPHNEKLLALAQQIGGQRVDMVLFTGQVEGKPKDEQEFLALVEFKRGWLDGNRIPGGVSDRDKLLMLLAHIDTCPWGIVCGWCNTDHREWQTKDSMNGTADKWYEEKIVLPEPHAPIFFAARLFSRDGDRERLQQLIEVAAG